MTVTKLENISRYRTRVYIDFEFAFILYPQDIRLYAIEENKDLDDLAYRAIMDDLLYNRAKNKALKCLVSNEQSELSIRQKLSRAMYPEEVVNKTIEYLYEYRYLDNTRYCRVFIESVRHTKSAYEIKNILRNKGVDESIINRTMDELNYDQKDELFGLMKKKIVNFDMEDEKSRTRFINFFIRKGFAYGEVKSCLDVLYNNVEDF